MPGPAPMPLPAGQSFGDFDVKVFRSPGLEALISAGQRQWDGIELVDLTPGLGRYFGTDEGLLVIRKPDNSDLPIEEGDVIQSIGGREPSSVSQAMRILRSYDAGEEVTIDVMRERKRRTLTVAIPSDP